METLVGQWKLLVNRTQYPCKLELLIHVYFAGKNAYLAQTRYGIHASKQSGNWAEASDAGACGNQEVARTQADSNETFHRPALGKHQVL
jgi:hypothetical protein